MSMVPIGFRALVEAAAGAGFDAVSVTSGVYWRGVRDEGLSAADMRTILADNQIFVSEVEAAAHWLTGPEDTPGRWSHRTTDDELMSIAASLGARVLVAVHFGSARPVGQAAEAFAALCDQAAREGGLRVALEFPAFATINDVAAAWEIVRLADRVNGGILVDAWHHYRGSADDAALRSVPGDKVMAVQLADADREPRGSLEEDVLLRRLPGEGSFGIRRLMGELDAMGVRAPVGIEVWDEALLANGPGVAAKRLGDALRSSLS
jgi:sugar phosphate isomerase/epimerase